MDIVEDQFRRQEPSTLKETGSRLDPVSAPPALSSGFDCNICLDCAAEPVVTLCGHLYCWPCIYKWLQLDSTTPQQCPVCKAAVTQTALVPLYGRGDNSKADDALDVPRRPSITMTASVISDSDAPGVMAQRAPHYPHHRQHSHQRRHDGGYMMSSSSTATTAPVLQQPTILGGTAIAVLPWVLGDHGMGMYYNPYPLIASGDSPRLRQQEAKVKRSLHRISVFLFCCAVLCLVVF